MWVTNANMCRLAGKIGVLAPGALADVVVCDTNPLDRVAVLAEPGAHFSAVVAAGRLVVAR